MLMSQLKNLSKHKLGKKIKRKRKDKLHWILVKVELTKYLKNTE